MLSCLPISWFKVQLPIKLFPQIVKKKTKFVTLSLFCFLTYFFSKLGWNSNFSSPPCFLSTSLVVTVLFHSCCCYWTQALTTPILGYPNCLLIGPIDSIFSFRQYPLIISHHCTPTFHDFLVNEGWGLQFYSPAFAALHPFRLYLSVATCLKLVFRWTLLHEEKEKPF